MVFFLLYTPLVFFLKFIPLTLDSHIRIGSMYSEKFQTANFGKNSTNTFNNELFLPEISELNHDFPINLFQIISKSHTSFDFFKEDCLWFNHSDRWLSEIKWNFAQPFLSQIFLDHYKRSIKVSVILLWKWIEIPW